MDKVAGRYDNLQRPKGKSPGMTRRSLIKKGIGALAGLSAATGALGTLGFFVDNKTHPVQPVENKPQVAKSDVQSPPVEVKKETQDDLIKKHPMLINCTDAEKESALKIIKGGIDHYSGVFKRADRTERTENTLKLKGQIDKSYEVIKGKIDELELSKNGLSDEQIKELLLNIIFVESGGKNGKVSSMGARGVCQLKPDTAEEAAKLVGIPFSKEKLMEVDYNIQLAAVHFRRLLNIFHDPSIAVWAYNLGNGNVIDAMEAYLKSVLKSEEFMEVSDELNKGIRSKRFDKLDPETDKDERKTTARIINYYKLNYVNLITSSAVQSWIDERNKDQNPITHINKEEAISYVPRIGAAPHFLKDEKYQKIAAVRGELDNIQIAA